MPTGIVTFKDGTSVLGTGTLDGSGQATFVTSAAQLSAGAHDLTAEYEGGLNFGGSISAVLGASLAEAGSTTILVISPTATLAGDTVGFAVSVASTVAGIGTPGGSRPCAPWAQRGGDIERDTVLVFTRPRQRVDLTQDILVLEAA